MSRDTQFENGANARKCYVNIGLDFGTSCTKVVLRTPYEKDRAFAVPFADAAHPSSHYLLPSLIWIDQSRNASLLQFDTAICVRDLKRHFMHSTPIPLKLNGSWPKSIKSHIAATTFLALTLQRIRQWFLHTHQSAYCDYQLVWHVNLGLPSADFDKKYLCHRYLRAIAAAWHLSVQETPIDLDAAEQSFEQVHVKLDESSDSKFSSTVNCNDGASATVCLLPEVAAEVVGYSRSNQREEGLHILMDVGAGTLDLCAFNLHQKNGDDRYELLTADVRELGAMVLHRSRLKRLREIVSENDLERWNSHDPVTPIPNTIHDYFSSDKIPPLPKSKNVDSEFVSDIIKMIWKTVVDLKLRRHPLSPRWKDWLPIFIAGGGSQLDPYQHAIRQVTYEMRNQYQGSFGLKNMSIAKPRNLEGATGISDNNYHRLAVAWGLSYSDVDIGNVTRPTEIEDVVDVKETKKGKLDWYEEDNSRPRWV